MYIAISFSKLNNDGIAKTNPYAVKGIPIVCMFTATLLCITSFLVAAIFTENHTQKGFHYSKGIIERAEAFLFFGFMILLPSHFVTLAYLYTTLTLITTIKRVLEFKRFCKNAD